MASRGEWAPPLVTRFEYHEHLIFFQNIYNVGDGVPVISKVGNEEKRLKTTDIMATELFSSRDGTDCTFEPTKFTRYAYDKNSCVQSH